VGYAPQVCRRRNGSGGTVVSTPREQLIEAIAVRFCAIGGNHGVCKEMAAAALRSLSDLGALVLVPVKSLDDLTDRQTVWHRQTYLQGYFTAVGQPDWRNYFVNALEGEQS
jgi:hypothetical protein